jgi:hypothetical protein
MSKASRKHNIAPDEYCVPHAPPNSPMVKRL